MRVLWDLGYESSKADLDVWICKAVTNSGHEYYEMLFMYVDDILSVSHKSQEAIAEIMTFFKPKDGSIKEPKIYLGDDVAKMQLPNGHKVWTMSPRTYVENAIKVIEQLLLRTTKVTL